MGIFDGDLKPADPILGPWAADFGVPDSKTNM